MTKKTKTPKMSKADALRIARTPRPFDPTRNDYAALAEALKGCTGATEVRVREERRCRWFARCENLATGTTPHPVLGEVPTCDRCHAFATGEER